MSVFSQDLERSRKFYADLLGLVPSFDSDWVVQLTSPSNEHINLTLQLRTHSSIPDGFRERPKGMSIAFVVSDVDSVFETANSMELEIVQAPKNEDYGQRRFLTRDPDGLLVDVSSPCEPSPEFIQQYMS